MSLGNTQLENELSIYEYCIENNEIRLGYGDDFDFTSANDRGSIANILKDPIEYAITAVNLFKNEMKIGDLVVISDGNLKFRAIGEISGDYKFDQNNDISFRQSRAVKWLFKSSSPIPYTSILDNRFSQMTIYKISEKALNREKLKGVLTKPKPSDSILPPNFVLIIDEINRGNVSAIFGELITLIEDSKRIGADDEQRVTLPYSKQLFGVPQNLHIIGTMNTADRSVEALDTALRRRFVFEEMRPRPDLLKPILVGTDEIDLPKILEAINLRLEALLDRDHTIGHANFMKVNSLVDLQFVFAHKVIPQLQEFFYNDWSKIQKILGKAFVTKEDKSVEFADCDQVDDYFEAKPKWSLTEVKSWHFQVFKSILPKAES